MPVASKGESVYQQEFQWQNARGRNGADLAKSAGYPSDLQHVRSHEPAIAHKKRIDSAPKSSIALANGNGDDVPYILLGQQEKFASNVQYKSRGKTLEHPKAPAEEEQVATPMAPRKIAPAPKVVYDTGAPKPKTSSAAPKPSVSTFSNGKIATKEGKIEDFFTPTPMPKEPAAPAKSEMIAPPRPKVSKTVPSKTKVVQPVENGAPKQERRKESILKKKESALKARPAPKESAKEPRVVESAPDVNYALAYKKGVAPPRSQGPKRMSEYAKQFTWKKGLASSPLLAAEQIVYKSNPSAPPFKPDSMKKYSEYATQFQPWANLMKSTPNIVKELRKDKIERASQEKIRSKSVEDLRMDKMPPAGVEPVTSADDKRFVQETMNPQKLHFPHGKRKSQSGSSILSQMSPTLVSPTPSSTHFSERAYSIYCDKQSLKRTSEISLKPDTRSNSDTALAKKLDDSLEAVGDISLESVYSPEKQQLRRPRRKLSFVKNLLSGSVDTSKQRSEYQSNFKQPQRFTYETGAWKGADPPQIVHRAEVETARTVDSIPDDPDSKNWFAEVVELRNRAQEYKKRALGTHFSRAHVGQLYAPQQADLWDEADSDRAVESGSVVSALSLEVASQVSAPSSRGSRREAWSQATTPGTCTPASQRTLTPERADSDIDDEVASVQEMISKAVAKTTKKRASTSSGGRVPTPKLRASAQGAKTAKIASRHHLDRTTPSIGGALLTSPPRHVTAHVTNGAADDMSIAGSDVSSCPGANSDRTTPTPLIAGQPQIAVAHGMPTRDSHVLMDEDTRSDHSMPTTFVQHAKNPNPALKMRTIREEASDTFKAKTPQHGLTVDDIMAHKVVPDDDVRSVSTMSVASSCSLASQTLEKARVRRDEFWGTKTSKAK